MGIKSKLTSNNKMQVIATHERCIARGCKSKQVLNKAYTISFRGTKVVIVSVGPAANTLLLDEEAYLEKCNQFTWSRQQNGYVYTNKDNNKFVHHFIMGWPTDDECTVDHINRQPLDNRRANLRWATQSQQNANRDSRCDKLDPPDELKAHGITHLPRYMRFDSGEQKFSFCDHPLISKLAANGVTINGSGTKARDNTLIQKFKHCLEQLMEMHKKHHALFPDDKDFMDRRMQLAVEYNEIVRFAHETDPESFPDGPYADLDEMHSEIQVIARMIDGLVDVAAAQTGAKQHTHTDTIANAQVVVRRSSTQMIDGLSDVEAAQTGAIVVAARCSSNDSITIFDSKHAPTLSQLNWDAADLRIHICPKVLQLFPAISDLFPGKKKIMLPDFVYHVLEQRPVLDGHVVVPYNNIKHDIRVENLVCMPGEAKNYKRPVSLQPPPFFGIGMTYLPKGIAMSEDRGKQVFIVKLGGTVKKFSGVTAANCFDIFTAKVLPLLHANDAEFDTHNAKYQRLLGEYEALV